MVLFIDYHGRRRVNQMRHSQNLQSINLMTQIKRKENSKFAVLMEKQGESVVFPMLAIFYKKEGVVTSNVVKFSQNYGRNGLQHNCAR